MLPICLLATPPALEVKIQNLPSRVVVGQPLTIEVAVRNPGKESKWVVTQNPGFENPRMPNCRIEVRKVGQRDWLDASLHPTCGNTNPIQLDEFVQLAPGKSTVWKGLFRPSEETLKAIRNDPGEYEIRFRYDTAHPIDDWIGGPLPEPLNSERKEQIRSRYDGTPKGLFESRPARVKFVLA